MTIILIMTLISILLLIAIYMLSIKLLEKIEEYKDWQEKTDELKKDNTILEGRKDSLKNLIDETERVLDDRYSKLAIITNELEQSQLVFNNSLENYCEILDKNYTQKEEEYNNLIKILQNSYEKEHDKILQDLQIINNELSKIKATRAAAQEALIKEKEIQADLSFYSLNPSNEDIDDIRALERVKPKLHQPRILCMLIWSTYFQKPMTTLCNNVLGLGTVTGVYKITNQETKECYIGQAVDVAKRWKDHAKCGLGIDTPANNKLYKAIQEYEIWNFTWELLEKCSKDDLNEKEKFYIELYQSKEYGYNSSIGIKK